ncbi:solute carrier family 2, facilitated glucose transporter member 6 [Callorhinchus milii]|uniref:solute carrier family 2, facilitated glucose transporter member 6 n=1 Tax=Callorhinchus milii TaxID=7868 RepID=UPI001C3FE905|nr:solute carrier family 2, facilitated glucose transporter member 6 [Callorhinchus milii]
MKTWLLSRASNSQYSTISPTDTHSPQQPPARKTSNARLYLAVFTVTLGNFSFGYSIVYSSPALKQLNETSNPRLHLDDTNKSWFASSYTLGAAFGGFMAILLNNCLGRKTIILVSIVPCVAGFALMAAAQAIWMLDFGRTLTGIAGGISVASIPMYVSEISTVEVRGKLGAGAQIMTVIGSFLLYLLDLRLSWRWLAGLGLIAPVVMFVLLLFMPESPRYLISANQNEKAIRALVWLRGPDADCRREFADIRDAARENMKRVSCADLKQPGIYKPVLMVVIMWALQQLSGITVILLYMELIFSQTQVVLVSSHQTRYTARDRRYILLSLRLRFCPQSGNADSPIVGVVRLLAVLVTSWLLDRTGRRKLLFASGQAMDNVTVTCLAGPQVTPAGLTLIPLLSIIIMVFGYSLGWGPITWLMTSELLPIRVRGQVSGLCVLFSWILSFLIANQFLAAQHHLGCSVPFFFFAAISLLSLVFTALFIPETMGLTLEEIEEYFQPISTTRQA